MPPQSFPRHSGRLEHGYVAPALHYAALFLALVGSLGATGVSYIFPWYNYACTDGVVECRPGYCSGPKSSASMDSDAMNTEMILLLCVSVALAILPWLIYMFYQMLGLMLQSLCVVLQLVPVLCTSALLVYAKDAALTDVSEFGSSCAASTLDDTARICVWIAFGSSVAVFMLELAATLQIRIKMRAAGAHKLRENWRAGAP